MKKLVVFVLFISFLSNVSGARKEKVFFNLKFGFIKGGEAELVISDTIFNDRKALHYHLRGRTTGLANTLYGVNDVYETTVDYETRLPLKSIRDIQEGKYSWYNETLYYHDIDSINSQKSGWKSVPNNLLDIISVFFYFINNHLIDDLKPGEELKFPTYHADEISDVTVKYTGDRRIDTEHGKIDCYVLAPYVDKGKVLKRSDGLRFFISKETKLPVLLEFDMRVGSLKAELHRYEVDGKEQAKR